MTERITRTFDVQWDVYQLYPRDRNNPNGKVYASLEDALDAARRRLLILREVCVQITRRETEASSDG